MEKLEIDDTNLNYSRTYKIDEPSFGTILRCCPELEELIITSWTSCNQRQLQYMMKEVEGSKLQVFTYKTGWITKEPKDVKSETYHTNWHYDAEEDKLTFSAVKK